MTLLMDKNIKKLTVKNIVEECGITRQAFYYHFEDIYDLVRWMFQEEAVSLLKRQEGALLWQEGLLQLFQYLQEELFPRIHVAGTPIRVWVLSASSGQEAFSLAMTIAEYQEKSHCQDSARIFATDAAYLEEPAERGDGFFTARQVASIPQALREKYLIPVEGGFQICPAVRKMVVFSPYDPLLDPPFSNIELVCCRRCAISRLRL